MGNLPVIKKESFFEKIKNTIKRLFGIYEEITQPIEVPQFQAVDNKNKFKEEIKFEEDLGKKKLLEIQKKLEEGGMTIELATELTKDLTDEEKNNLLELYQTQITELEESLQNYKKRILAIRKRV